MFLYRHSTFQNNVKFRRKQKYRRKMQENLGKYEYKI